MTYSDGKSEFRQVKWSNSARNVEEEQSNPDKYSEVKHIKLKVLSLVITVQLTVIL